MGVSQAHFLSLLGRHSPKDAQGLGVGLRTTFNRLGSFAAPVAMGAAAEAFGLTAAFLVAGALLAAATVAMAALAWRARL